MMFLPNRASSIEGLSKVSILKKSTNRLKSLSRLLGIVLFASVLILPASNNKAEADGPSGATKRLIVRHSKVLGSSTDNPIEDANIDGYVNTISNLRNLPYSIVEADEQGEQSLRNSGQIQGVFEDRPLKLFGDTQLPSIGANPSTLDFVDSATSQVYTGDGYAVAIIDTGVDKNHDALSGKVVKEACFSVNYAPSSVSSLCPGGVQFTEGNNTASDCTLTNGCGHGTKVAGATAMKKFSFDPDGDSVDDHTGGVAVDAKIIALKVVSKITDSVVCDGDAECARPYLTSVLEASDYLASLNVGMPIASANISIGGGEAVSNYNSCRSSGNDGGVLYDAFYSSFGLLRSKNITPVIANGNSGNDPAYVNGIAFPACVEGAVAVGATNIKGNAMASYSQNSVLTTLLAPGGDYDGSNPDSFMFLPKAGTGNGLAGSQGTSFAAPMVAGAYAVLREKHPNASVSQLTKLLQDTGVNVNDGRSGYTVGSKKRINLASALSSVVKPSISNFAGPSNINENASTTLSVDVSNASSCSLNNGIGAVDVDDEIVVPGRSSYTLTCKNLFGDIATANFAPSGFNTKPTTPGNGQPLNIEHNVDNRSAKIGWTGSTDDDGIKHYEIFLDGQKMGTTASTSFTLADLGLNHEYTVAVVAVDSLGAISDQASQGFVLGATSVPGTPNTGLFNSLSSAIKAMILSSMAIATSAMMIGIFKRLKTTDL